LHKIKRKTTSTEQEILNVGTLINKHRHHQQEEELILVIAAPILKANLLCEEIEITPRLLFQSA
jgi:hypothetical protein